MSPSANSGVNGRNDTMSAADAKNNMAANQAHLSFRRLDHQRANLAPAIARAVFVE